jgi:uncharacterized protein YdeI (YjbR/CyaY-like superfamily)
VRRGFDETYYLQRYSGRRRGSSWSVINAGRADQLSAAGRMREPGRAEIDRARSAGRFPRPRDRAAPQPGDGSVSAK